MGRLPGEPQSAAQHDVAAGRALIAVLKHAGTKGAYLPHDWGADDSGHIYVIGEAGPAAGGAVNIGLSRTRKGVASRVKSLATGNPRPLTVLATAFAEHARWREHQLHALLSERRSQPNTANEWFDLPPPAPGPGWAGFLDDAIAQLQQSDQDSQAAADGHGLAHVHGVPRHLAAQCACGWRGPEGNVWFALATHAAHRQVNAEADPSGSTGLGFGTPRLTPAGEDDAVVLGALLSTPPAAWRALNDAHAAWARTPAAVQPDGPPSGPPLSDDLSSLAFPEYSAETYLLIQALHTVGAVAVYDWTSNQWWQRFPDGAGVDTAPVPEVCRLLTAVLRGERLSGGTIAAAVRMGTFEAAVARLIRFASDEGLA